jgi:hypothetical protein
MMSHDLRIIFSKSNVILICLGSVAFLTGLPEYMTTWIVSLIFLYSSFWLSIHCISWQGTRTVTSILIYLVLIFPSISLSIAIILVPIKVLSVCVLFLFDKKGILDGVFK